jgi:hypothetical protein
VGGVAEPLEMRNVPRKSSRAYYRKMSESSGQHSLALPAMSDRNSARLSRRYEMTEFAQSNFKAVAPTSAGMLKSMRSVSRPVCAHTRMLTRHTNWVSRFQTRAPTSCPTASGR